jgi:hypothetical protein
MLTVALTPSASVKKARNKWSVKNPDRHPVSMMVCGKQKGDLKRSPFFMDQ